MTFVTIAVYVLCALGVCTMIAFAGDIKMQPFTCFACWGFMTGLLVIFIAPKLRNTKTAEVPVLKEPLLGSFPPTHETGVFRGIFFAAAAASFALIFACGTATLVFVAEGRDWCALCAITCVTHFLSFPPLLRNVFNGTFSTGSMHWLGIFFATVGAIVMSFDSATYTFEEGQAPQSFSRRDHVSVSMLLLPYAVVCGLCLTCSMVSVTASLHLLSELAFTRVFGVTTGVWGLMSLCCAICTEDVGSEFVWEEHSAPKWFVVFTASCVATVVFCSVFSFISLRLDSQQVTTVGCIVGNMAAAFVLMNVVPSSLCATGAAMIACAAFMTQGSDYCDEGQWPSLQWEQDKDNVMTLANTNPQGHGSYVL